MTESSPVIASQELPRSDGWSYAKAFERNLGLISESEQETLRNSRIAIAGMGGVGGVHLVSLARQGVGKFTIADPDHFDIANTNRQYGAMVSNYGRSKAETMAAICRDINPEVDLRILNGPVTSANADEFLDGADLFVDGLDFFVLDVRRCLFRLAHARKMFAITAAPVGFSASWLVFDPEGMSFDQYFDIDDSQSVISKLAAFAVGVAPKATHLRYMDISRFSMENQTAPCSMLACQLASAVVTTEVIRLLLKRRRPRAAPYYQQFDPYAMKFICGWMPWGNRNPIQRIRRWVLLRKFRSACAK